MPEPRSGSRVPNRVPHGQATSPPLPHMVRSSEQQGSHLQALEAPWEAHPAWSSCSSTRPWRPLRVLAETTFPPASLPRSAPTAQPQGPPCDLASALQAADP